MKVEKINTYTGHDGSVYIVIPAFENGKFLSGSSDKIVSQWSIDGLTPPIAIAQASAIIYALCIIPDQSLLLIGTSVGSIHVIDLAQKKEIRLLQIHSHAIFHLNYSARHKLIYCCGGNGSLLALNAADFSVAHQLQLCNEKARQSAMHPSKDELAVACGDGTVRILNARSLEEQGRIPAHSLSANCVEYHPDEKYLVSGGRDAHLNFWDANNYGVLKKIPAHNYAIYGITFSPDGKLFATGSRDKTIKIWNADSFEMLARIDKEKSDGHMNSVNSVCWMKNPDCLVSAGDDRSIRLWKVTQDE